MRLVALMVITTLALVPGAARADETCLELQPEIDVADACAEVDPAAGAAAEWRVDPFAACIGGCPGADGDVALTFAGEPGLEDLSVSVCASTGYVVSGPGPRACIEQWW